MSEHDTYTIGDLRGDLAATIKQLRAGDKDMTIEKAKAIGDIAQTIINSAKVEVDMARALGAKNMKPTGFMLIEEKPGQVPAIEADTTPARPQLTRYGDDGEKPRPPAPRQGPVGAL